MKEELKTIIRYCKDTNSYLLICEECSRALLLGKCQEIPKDCSGEGYEGNIYAGHTWKKVL